jgi:hypothetical protein
MTDGKTFTFTNEQVIDIFKAGIRRGSEEEACYQSGCKPEGRQRDELINAVYDIVNEGKNFIDNTDYISHSVVESWFKGYN